MPSRNQYRKELKARHNEKPFREDFVLDIHRYLRTVGSEWARVTDIVKNVGNDETKHRKQLIREGVSFLFIKNRVEMKFVGKTAFFRTRQKYLKYNLGSLLLFIGDFGVDGANASNIVEEFDLGIDDVKHLQHDLKILTEQGKIEIKQPIVEDDPLFYCIVEKKEEKKNNLTLLPNPKNEPNENGDEQTPITKEQIDLALQPFALDLKTRKMMEEQTADLQAQLFADQINRNKENKHLSLSIEDGVLVMVYSPVSMQQMRDFIFQRLRDFGNIQ